MRHWYCVALVLILSGCVSERQFARDSWPFGNPNAPVSSSETAQRALGHDTDVPPIVPQAGNVWPGPVQPVPTLSDEQQNMTEPLGQAYTPSLPSPYPPGTEPPPNPDLGIGPLGAPGTQTFTPPAGLAPSGITPSGMTPSGMTPSGMAPPVPGVAPYGSGTSGGGQSGTVSSPPSSGSAP